MIHSATLNAWLVVFVLPINSALNPVIYTLAAPTELHRRMFKTLAQLSSSLKQSVLYQKFFYSRSFIRRIDGISLSISGVSIESKNSSIIIHSTNGLQMSNMDV